MTPAPGTLGGLLRAIAGILQTDRPLAAIDLEATGTNPEFDRIVELTVARVEPSLGPAQEFFTRLNPGRPIPPEAAAIHGISDADVAGAPTFRQVAPHVLPLLAGADLIGYNHRRFDVRLIAAECRALALDDPCDGTRLIDVGLIFMKREPRTLAAALQFFCSEAHEGAHGSLPDVVATLRVLLAQFERYPDLPRDVAALDAIGRDPSFIDREGKFIWRGGQACIGFGKHQGVPLRSCDRGFLCWMLDKDFPDDTKAIVREALEGRYPTPTAALVEQAVA